MITRCRITRWASLASFVALAAPTPVLSSAQERTDAAPRAFDTDQRLDVRITIDATQNTHSLIFKAVASKTEVELDRVPKARGYDFVPLVFACADAPARSFLDALAARLQFCWEPRRLSDRHPTGYVLSFPFDGRSEAFGSKGDFEKRRFEAGDRFHEEFLKQPAELQDRLLSNTPLDVSSMPEALMGPLRDMLSARESERAVQGQGATAVTSESLGSAKIRIQKKEADGFDRWFFMVHINGAGTTGWRWNNYERKAAEYETSRQKALREGKALPVYDTRHNRLTRTEAKALPELGKLVSLNLASATFPDVLASLHRRYGINYVCDPKATMPQRANVKLGPMPLGEALDRLTEIYKETEWEWRKFGFLVVRGPKNPAREKKGSAS